LKPVAHYSIHADALVLPRFWDRSGIVVGFKTAGTLPYIDGGG
jgi:hypothetical protein